MVYWSMFLYVVCSGLVDARNTALLAWRMMSDGCLLTLTKSLRGVSSVTGDSTHCVTPQPIRSRRWALLKPRVSLSLSGAGEVQTSVWKRLRWATLSAAWAWRAADECVSIARVAAHRPLQRKHSAVCRRVQTARESQHTGRALRHDLRPRDSRRLLAGRSPADRGGGAWLLWWCARGGGAWGDWSRRTQQNHVRPLQTCQTSVQLLCFQTAPAHRPVRTALALLRTQRRVVQRL